jgi:hypothetical protein
VTDFVRYYLRTYQNYALDFWENLTPMQYGCILIGVAVCGYILMKTAR